jgi:hypothetical protein
MPDGYTTVPLFGGGTSGKSLPVSAQKRVNLYCEPQQEPDRTQMALYTRPGLITQSFSITDPFSSTAPSTIVGPVRGISTVPQQVGGMDFVHAVIGNALVQVQGRSQIVSYGPSFFATTGYVMVEDNGLQAACADGGAGMIYGYSTIAPFSPTYWNSYANVPTGMRTVAFLGGRFFIDDPSNNGRFRWSAQYDGTLFNALDYATAEQSPDPLSGVFEYRGQLLLLGTQTMEFWQLTGDLSVISKVVGSTIMWGSRAIFSVKKIGNQMGMIARSTAMGTYQVIMLDGYNATPVSTPDVEADIANEVSPDSISASVLTHPGHIFYVIHLSTKSWAYDVSTSTWSQWSTDGGRFAGMFAFQLGTRALITDYRDQRIYVADQNTYTDSSLTMIREVTSRHQFESGKRMRCFEMWIDMEVGDGLSSGQGSAPIGMLTISKDGGRTYGNEIQISLGAMGQYTARMQATRLGISRDWVFKVRVSDPIKVVALQGFARFG